MAKRSGKSGRKERAKQAAGQSAARSTVPVFSVPEGFWKRNYPAAIIVFLLPLLLYFAAFRFGYVLDDVIVLSENQFVKQGLSGIDDIFSNDVFTGYLGGRQDLVQGGRYRPLSLVTFAVEYEFFGLNPLVNHLGNALWYGLLGLLILRVLDMLFPGAKRWYFSVPFIAALLYITHPVHSEAVANIKGRDEIMTFVLAMAALYLVLRYLAKPQLLTAVASGAVFLLALLAKENALTFLAVIPLTLYTFTNARWPAVVKSMIAPLAATVVYLVIRYQVVGQFLGSEEEVQGLMNNPFRDMTGGEKYATIFYTLWEYLRLLVFPHPLTHDYYPYHIPVMQWSDPGAFLPFLLYLGMGAYALYALRRRGSVVAWAIGFFLITLSITSNVVFTIGTFMNERFLFMPSLAFSVLVAWLAVRILPGKWQAIRHAHYYILGGVLLLSAAYAGKTLARVPVWENSFTLNRAAVKVSVNSARANNFMGYDYYLMGLEETDRQRKGELFDTATYYIDRALKIHPDYPDALRVRAGLYGGQYQLDGDLGALLNGFHRLLQVQYVPYIDEYLEYLNNRGNPDALIGFYLKTGYGLFAQTRGQYVLARKYLNYAYQLNPNHPKVLEAIAVVSYLQGQYQQAVNIGRRALQIDPTLPDANRYVDLALQRMNAGR